MTRDDGSECFDPGFQTICHHTLIALSDRMSTSAAAVAPQSGGSRRARAVAVNFFLGQHGPDDPCGLGGERPHGDLVGPPSQQLAQPGIADAAPLLLPQIGAGAVDQQCAQHAVCLEMRPGRCLPPVPWSRPVMPTQAAKSRPERNTLASGTFAKVTLAMIGPTIGSAINRWASGSRW